MKTIFCWLIANLESHLGMMVLFVLFYPQFSDKNEISQKTEKLSSVIKGSEDIAINSLIVCVIVAFILAILTAVFTYRNFDEVISRQFKWRNSNVERFEARLNYTLTRFMWSMIVYCIYLLILSYQLFV